MGASCPGGFMKRIGVTAFLLLLGTTPARGQSKLSVKWEELTAGDFRAAIQQAKGTCLLPFGILEKHGPHLLLGTDLLNVRSEEHTSELQSRFDLVSRLLLE